MEKREDGYNVSDSGNWNVASDYSRLKIMKPLDFIDHYENIARFGYDTLMEEVANYGVPLDSLKLIGFERMVNEMIKLIGNCRFAMKSGKTKELIDSFDEKLKKIRSLIPMLSNKIKKQNGTIIKLNKNYYIMLDYVSEIKASINEPLNKNHLIFTDKEEFNPKAYKDQIIKDAISRG